MSEAFSILEMLRVGAGGALVAIGLVFMAGGALALWRFPDFYTRLHSYSVSDAVGAAAILIGLAIASGDLGMALKLLLLAALIVALAPTITHMAANAAHAAGLAPIAGRYTAPRPGAKKTPS